MAKDQAIDDRQPLISTHEDRAESVESVLVAKISPKIGSYDIVDESGRVETTLQSRERVKAILGKAGVTALHKGARNTSNDTARQRFSDYLIMHVLHNHDHDFQQKPGATVDRRIASPEECTTSMETLLGKEGLNLYKLAIEEEANDQNFRDAVFLESIQHVGKKFGNRNIIWVGGPSASGKSSATDAILKDLAKHMPENKSPLAIDDDIFVSVDGGIVRNVSQMRQLVLQVALKKGFPGIQDLHNNTKLHTKSYVQEAALQNPRLNLIIPETFANPLFRFWKQNPFDKMSQRLTKLNQNDATSFRLCEVIAEPYQDKQFQSKVERLGNQRAWSQKFDAAHTTECEIKINDRNLPCESKRYQPQYFKDGRDGSVRARTWYAKNRESAGKPAHYTPIVNDLVWMQKDKASATWRISSPDVSQPGSATLVISKHDLARWAQESKENQVPLEEWVRHEKTKATLGQRTIRSQMHTLTCASSGALFSRPRVSTSARSTSSEAKTNNSNEVRKDSDNRFHK
ncbi:MAG: hypothetical protein A3F43_00610 [Gammaproteobacteria bacterium RIFCSPHIGHO2_12_FULL_42_10]|nr:MAG: hypothetical protein A3F43_00610 [Gammaproteobacteria bacterium RIFCSPHIGHO2_12_FULL_42_10]